MAKDKYDFVQKLLENKKLQPAQLERVLNLSMSELIKDGISGSQLDIRIKNLENLIKNKTESTNKKNNNIFGLPNDIKNYSSELIVINPPAEKKQEQEQKIDYINPFNLYQFLLEYNKNPTLRSTCHDIDSDMLVDMFESEENYLFSAHLQNIKSSFEDLSKQYKATTKMYSLIRSYLYGEKDWSSQKIKYSWSDKNLNEWSIKNLGLVPNPSETLIEKFENEGYFLPRPFVSQITGVRVETFTDLVLFFKSLWHIKDQNPLKKILENIHQSFNYGWAEISYSENFSRTINLYTDVDKLIQAHKKLLDVIKKVMQENEIKHPAKIELSFYQEGRNIIYSVRHKNSIFMKSPEATIEKPFGQLLTPLIKNQINGLCDLILRAEFENKRYEEINLWDGKKCKSKELPIFEGVEYLLKFKTKSDDIPN